MKKGMTWDGFSGQFFGIKPLCFVVAIKDMVLHGVKTIFHLL